MVENQLLKTVWWAHFLIWLWPHSWYSPWYSLVENLKTDPKRWSRDTTTWEGVDFCRPRASCWSWLEASANLPASTPKDCLGIKKPQTDKSEVVKGKVTAMMLLKPQQHTYAVIGPKISASSSMPRISSSCTETRRGQETYYLEISGGIPYLTSLRLWLQQATLVPETKWGKDISDEI